MADGTQHGVQGLLTGTVVQVADPEGLARVQVNVRALGAAGEGLWARLASGYASNGAGMVFVPEVGDEVVIGLLDGDAASPVILGSLYGATHRPPRAVDAANNVKAIVSRSQVSIEIDEDAKRIRISTPGGQSITLDDAARSVTVLDANNNQVTLAPEGMTLRAARNLTIQAGGQLTLAGDQGVSIRAASGDATVDAINVTAHALTALKAVGDMTAELNSRTQTTVRGAMVMIN